MLLFTSTYQPSLATYLQSTDKHPLFIAGDALEVVSQIPTHTIDCCMTSPPYWGQREYKTAGIGQESSYQLYLDQLGKLFAEIKRVLKPTGSFWLNIGDSYHQKNLLGLPWRIALKLTDEQGWILRNSVVWHKVKGGLDNSADRLRNVHEQLFHFVQIPTGYYYDLNAIRSKARQAKVRQGAVVSATGVTGVRYKRQIELSTALTEAEKQAAQQALNQLLKQIELGEISDFRMVIRGQQRTTHSDGVKVSGRARELAEKGFYFLKYHPNGSKPSDVWDILPEDSQNRTLHYAPYPEDLCKIPLLATCPPAGVVLDPFCGTGTTNFVAQQLERKSVGIDISAAYLQIAQTRCEQLL